MEHPKRQIPTIIHALTSGTPAEQKSTLDTYFLPSASFYHPLCRVPPFAHVQVPLVGELDSRWVIWMIYRWYRILSPRIELVVEGAEFNQEMGVLFVEISQVFSLFFVPFAKSHVHLTTKLGLVKEKKDDKYYIAKQEDLYQFNEVVKFFWPGGDWTMRGWQVVTTVVCVLGALVFWPLTVFFERRNFQRRGVELKNGN
ncbi:hypothetical protein HYFRA_00002287 [Hymenoscyphus fraxineus]|uniref:SigF-like NTF2-like domain-containing protein n=1 Tax=Hymenoscyphus fraxineus TaxID=746836 RepID=A0A9N9L931_9HELO|nr:hypothetical protein HYFRA_00002287 [Hymenoscyphus fraxineus]